MVFQKTMDDVETESGNRAGPENLMVELGLILGIAFLCVIFFIFYIANTTVEVNLNED